MLSTKNLEASSKGPRPIIDAGNQKVKINAITFDQTPWNKDAYNIVLHVETEPIGGDFEGFLIDKDNPNKGRYEGQVGRVRLSKYVFENGETKSGRTKNRDEDVLKAMNSLAVAMDLKSDLDQVEAEDIFVFMDACDKIFANSEYVNMCIGGREWENKDGYINLDMFLVPYEKGKVPVERDDVDNSRLIEFDESKHIQRIKKKDVDGFESDSPFDGGDFDI